MEFLDLLSINVNILLAIIGISEYIKSIDRNNKLKKVYWLIPFVISGIAVLTINFGNWIKFFQDWLVYMGISVLIYQNIIKYLKTILNKISSPKPKQKTPLKG